MTDIGAGISNRKVVSLHTSAAAQARLKRRYRSEARFKWIGAGAVAIAVLFLVVLLSTIMTQAFPAFTMNYVMLTLDLSESKIDRKEPEAGDYDTIIREAFSARFPDVSGRNDKRALRSLISTGAPYELRNRVVADPSIIGRQAAIGIPLDDFADLFYKGLIAENQTRQSLPHPLATTLTDGEAVLAGTAVLLDIVVEQTGAHLSGDGILKLDDTKPSVLLESGEAILKLKEISAAGAKAVVLSGGAKPGIEIGAIRVIEAPQGERKLSDKEIVWLDRLRADGLIENRWNTTFLFTGASREPEMAGIWGAVVGSFLTLVVTLALCFPIGVATAVYLEEFAPKNRWTHLIEVNINNLAAVPSIVFGLLGLAVFLGFFGLPRSAALVGGMVLALMTLPTIIIAARAALRAVPPSIREAALGIGASRLQTVTHHVLPLAMPGILTGTIIGMAQALGETAPLLMIGMVAFIVDIPGGLTDPATVLPVQIFMWADFPEPAFRQKTAAAILILLGFLVLMNALAVILRKRFERRW